MYVWEGREGGREWREGVEGRREGGREGGKDGGRRKGGEGEREGGKGGREGGKGRERGELVIVTCNYPTPLF